MTTVHPASKRWPEVAVPAAALLLASVCVYGLAHQLSVMWLLCPQALAVMFYRQSLRPYDSLGAADTPDFIVAALYFPLVGWQLNRAYRKGELRGTALWICIGHLAAVALAIVTAKFRNEVWAYQLGS